MALVFNGNLPRISGNIKIEVPTPTYSGTSSSNVSDSINPYTGQGPGAGGSGQTISEISAERAGGDTTISLLLHADDEINTTDSSTFGHTLNNFGGIVTTSVEKKFGARSYTFNSASQYVSIDSHEGFQFGTDDFTVELWFNPLAGGDFPVLLSTWSVSSSDAWIIHYDIAIANAKTITFWANSAGGSPIVQSAALTLGNWHHIAVSRDAGTTRLFVNGVLAASSTANYNITNNSSFPLQVGHQLEFPARWVAGYLDEIRVTKGVAHYTSAFTVPSAPF